MLNRYIAGLLVLIVVSLFTLSACKNYPPEIKKVCDDACTIGCQESCDADFDYSISEKGTCRASCKIGYNIGCKDSYLEDIPDYDSSILQPHNGSYLHNPDTD